MGGGVVYCDAGVDGLVFGVVVGEVLAQGGSGGSGERGRRWRGDGADLLAQDVQSLRVQVRQVAVHLVGTTNLHVLVPLLLATPIHHLNLFYLSNHFRKQALRVLTNRRPQVHRNLLILMKSQINQLRDLHIHHEIEQRILFFVGDQEGANLGEFNLCSSLFGV